MKNLLLLSCIFAVLSISPGLCRADVVSYFDRPSFAAALAPGSQSYQNFDSYAPGTILSRTIPTNGITYLSSQGSVIVTNFYSGSTGANSIGSTSSPFGFPYNFFQADEIVSFYFSSPIMAFGIDINTASTAFGQYVSEINLNNHIYFSDSAYDPFGGLYGQFVGFTSDTPFSAVAIVPWASTSYEYNLDSLTYVNAPLALAPEPSTLGICGFALATVILKVGARRNAKVLPNS